MNTDHALVPAASQLPAVAAGETTAQIMPAHVAAVVPFHDYEKWEACSVDQRTRVSRLLDLFAELVQAPEGVVAAAERLSVLNGMSASNLLALRTKFRKQGWTALAKIYKGPSELPEEFVKWVKGRVLGNKRGTRAVLQMVRDEFAQGESVPGFGTWQEWYAVRFPERDIPERFAGCYPKGWSESNLYKKQPTRPQRKAAREGWAHEPRPRPVR